MQMLIGSDPFRTGSIGLEDPFHAPKHRRAARPPRLIIASRDACGVFDEKHLLIGEEMAMHTSRHHELIVVQIAHYKTLFLVRGSLCCDSKRW